MWKKLKWKGIIQNDQTNKQHRHKFEKHYDIQVKCTKTKWDMRGVEMRLALGVRTKITWANEIEEISIR